MGKKAMSVGLIALCVVGLWAINESRSQESTKERMAERLSAPRIAPLAETEWTEEQRKELESPYKEGNILIIARILSGIILK